MLKIESSDHFVNRHIGLSPAEQKEMLTKIGVSSLDELIDQTIPKQIRSKKKLKLPQPLSEYAYLKEIRKIAAKNKSFKSYIGLGYHDTIVPPVILRNVLENPGWYTAYTPYQAEISQGRLEALLNFQTMISDLTGLPIANASLLDEGTAVAEAMMMLYGQKNKRAKGDDIADECILYNNVFAQTRSILESRGEPHAIQFVEGNGAPDFTEKTFAIIIQYPDSTGNIEQLEKLVTTAHKKGIYVIVAADIMSLALYRAPGEWGADVVVGTSQRFGVPMGFGGPHAAYFACKEDFKRIIPGRIIGVSIDAQGNPALRMALQTREQHIRRERATSNICTAQALLAIMASMYAVYHGPDGIRNIATNIHLKAKLLSEILTQNSFEQLNDAYFDTLQFKFDKKASLNKIKKKALKAGINFRYENTSLYISVDESTLAEDLWAILMVFDCDIDKKEFEGKANKVKAKISAKLKRKTTYLEHPVFNSYHSESQMMRYIKRLENKDLSLVHSMIPLGSCTMKLNAVAELIPVTFPEFGNIHPFVPLDQAGGYQHMFEELEAYLCQVTGFSACSLQPNSGAQGEYAGLMVIRAYHETNGNTERNIALIPSSAHGTNPASAVMAGMKVVVVKCDDSGNIELADLKAKAIQYKDTLAALMVTYPSTHGVFEIEIKTICDLIHENGGKVYMDGANMNAQVGLTSPGAIHADVCHLNLHKTFSIPHGGGGPGMGPICVNDSLKDYLPAHVFAKTGGKQGIKSISAAPWGSASILLISYAYIKMLGQQGVVDATKVAILNANYIQACLENDYNVLYKGEFGRVAHELILDLRPFKALGVEAEDVAKRLIDYGFHAPTLSFPVAGTIMIEPTESEDKEELDRFCNAMIQIRKEMDEIARGDVDEKNNVLKNAPHSIHLISANEWPYPYTREKAAFPLPFVRERKFWVPVGRVNNSHGDRNLICTCPPIEMYETQES